MYFPPQQWRVTIQEVDGSFTTDTYFQEPSAIPLAVGQIIISIGGRSVVIEEFTEPKPDAPGTIRAHPHTGRVN